ncbi:hypothetical protein [Gloeothece citriformis]|nr:hypothetical protein [Gloeothece citriformis]
MREPVVFEVNGNALYNNGHQFYCSDNGVWLVETVPPTYLKQIF